MIIPAIDLLDGEVVRLYQGDYQQKTRFAHSPLAQLESYQAKGAQWLHLVDLSGAKDASRRQTALIKDIASTLTAKLQVGGGIRDEAHIQTLLDAGVSRIVIGSLAVKKPALVMEWMQKYGVNTLCLALDVNISASGEKRVAVSGWQQESNVCLESVTDQFLAAGLKHALVTDISRDGTLKGANTDLYQELAKKYSSIEWQASGGIADLKDVAAVRQTGATSLIIGKALLIENFSLEEAIACWQNV